MAIVDSDKRYIFIHIFKTAGNSVRQAMGVDPEETKEFMGGHVDSWAVRHGLGKHDRGDDWDNFFKFTFVRNPFDWLVSVYHHMKTWGEGWRQAPVKEQNMSFEQFLNYIVFDLMSKEQDPTINKYQLQKDFVTDHDGAVMVDFIGRFEHLDRDVKVICRKLLKGPAWIQAMLLPHPKRT